MLAKELDCGRHAAFFYERRPRTPCLLLDLDVVAARYRELAAALPQASIYYAVKAQPDPWVIRTLATLGSCFDVASRGELDLVLALGIAPGRISYGNTIKAEEDIAHAWQRGVRLFAFDSASELGKLARAAPESRVFCRILVSSDGARWPLSGKFGCSPSMAADLLAEAPALGLEPCGVSFHPGSQQLNPGAWQAGCDQAADIFRRLRPQVRLSMVNLGGGFPARLDPSVPDITEYGKAIDAAVAPLGVDTVIAEPGRFLVADAGVLWARVELVTRKDHGDPVRWVYVNAGRFHGLAETEGEAIEYPVMVYPNRGGPVGRVVLAGPTCDSYDVIYQRRRLYLPLRLEEGDRGDYVLFLGAGAYTVPYASRFNGFPPPVTHVFGGIA